jgi:hypothetical protein
MTGSAEGDSTGARFAALVTRAWGGERERHRDVEAGDGT